MDGHPSEPPPLPFPPTLEGSQIPSPVVKRRGRPPGSVNKPRAPGEKRPYKKKAKIAPPPSTESDQTVVSALGFSSSAPMIRSADLAIKVESSASALASAAAVAHAVAAANGRAPRASKVNAALKMGESARSKSSPPSSPEPEAKVSLPPPSNAQVKTTTTTAPTAPPAPGPPLTSSLDPSAPASLAKNPSIAFHAKPKAVKLDMSSVKTLGPRVPQPRTEPRAFGLTEAPTFYPTRDEFKDPMEYIRWCGDEGGAKEYGICKIVPPEGWQPPFVMDTEVSQGWLLGRGRGGEASSFLTSPRALTFGHQTFRSVPPPRIG